MLFFSIKKLTITLREISKSSVRRTVTLYKFRRPFFLRDRRTTTGANLAAVKIQNKHEISDSVKVFKKKKSKPNSRYQNTGEISGNGDFKEKKKKKISNPKPKPKIRNFKA